MEEVRQLVQEEGREARNLVAFHVVMDSPSRISRKPPRAGPVTPRRAPPRPPAAPRLRSASAGRDKRSELRARYWALLFGDLQRAIGEIYNTVEAHENLSECQEVILVLENYTRDFKALCEWFRLKWEYDNTPPPQRPQSLAWEVRKTDFVRPESRRAHSVKSSPSVSGKNSPSLSGYNTPSGKNSPNLTGKISPGSGKVSPRVCSGITSPKGNVEFFSNKIATKFPAKPEAKAAKESRLSDIKEKVSVDLPENEDLKTEDAKDVVVEIGEAKECPNVSPKPVVIKTKKPKANVQKKKEELSSHAKSTIAALNVMECSFLEKQLLENAAKNDNNNMINKDKPEEVKSPEINEKVDDKGKVVENGGSMESPNNSEDNFADVSNESSPVDDKINSSNDDKAVIDTNGAVDGKIKSPDVETAVDAENGEIDEPNEAANDNVTPKTNDLVSDVTTNQNKEEPQIIDTKATEVNGDATAPKEEVKKDQEVVKTELKIEVKPSRPAYSQAAAKPKLVTPKVETKPPMKTTPIVRSKTVVEMRPVSAAKTQNKYPKKNQQTNKCSYPFNLTTGRTLFDFAPPPPNNKPGAKKPVPLKNMQMATGDLKNKPDAKKLPPRRPSTLKVNEKGDKCDKVNPQLEKIKDYDEYGSSDTVVAQIDMNRIESSDSLKTLVPEELLAHDVANSIEVLNVDGNKTDNDGWLTVKSRRLSRESKKQSKSHWSNRFHQPSATTSLPTLNMIESPRQESKSIIENSKFDRAKSEQPQTGIPVPKEKSVKVNAAQKPKSDRSKDTSMIRQKSDVTGLKTRSARNKSFKKTEKAKEPKSPEHTGSELTKNRLHSSLESLSGLSRSQESTEDPFDFDKWKAEFKSYFKYLEEDDQMPNQNEILQSADPSEMSELAEMTSQIEENERKMALALDFQSEVDQRKLCEEEDLLNRQIMELQQVSDVDLDTETDDTETDAELHCGDRPPPPMIQMSQNNLGSLAASLEDQYESALAGMSWAERVDTLVVLEELVARDPGRAQQLHAKLSTGIKRRGSFQDALRRLQAKQARAEQQRLDLQTERSKRIHCLLTRVEEVKVAKNQLIEEKRLRMERRLQKAEENRNQHLKHIVRKAHDEEEKLREIAFIKQLEAENRRHDFLDQCRSHTTRLRQLRREHMLKLEQKAAREAAVGARRQAIEEARRLHVETLLEKRKERDARVEELKEQKKQERDDAAREKAEGVKSRLSALAAAAELEADALRSRIRDKQESTQQRLATHLQAIRSKATAPRQATTSESQELNEEEETDRLNQEKREKERQKAIKKRARKLRQKLLAIGNIFEQLSGQEIGPPLLTNTKIWKLMTQINNILTSIAPVDNKSCKKKDINQNGIDSNSDILAKSDANLNDSKELNGIDNHVTTEKKKKKKKASSEEKQVVPSDEVKSNVKDEEPEEKVTNINKNCINYIKKCEIKTLNDSKNQKLKEMGPELFAAMLNDQKPKESSTDTNAVTNNNEPNYPQLKESSPDRNTVTNVNETNNQKQKESSSDTNIATNGTNNQILKESSPDTNAATNINGTNNQNLKESSPDTNAASNKKSKSKKKADKIKEQEATKVDKPAKLSKTSSVASSMSDMSKVSSSKKDMEKRPIVNVDWMHLEKILNELNRIMEKVDKHSQEVLVHGLRIFSQIINMAVDKEENGAQVTTRSLTACVQMISRVVGGCPIAAAYFMNTNGCVHLAKLLSQQLEKDLEADKNEMALAAATADSLSISLDSVLVTTRLHEEWKEDPSKTPRDDVPMLQSLRQRAHGTVSYICLSGCITRAEDAGSIRESVIAMATVCADLCHPCDVDTGQDRANALHSLRASLAGSLCGSRSEFCQLFDRGAALQYNGTHAEFVKAARTAHLLKAAAQLDHTIVQDAFGEGRWPLEFRAAVARLLSQHAPNDREAPRQKSNWVVNCRLDHKLSETMVLDLITLLGFVVVNNPQHQETICDGWSAVKTLCTLPANWIVSRPHCHALLPTLAALAQHPPAAAVIASELSLKMIEEYLASPEAQRVKLVQVILEGRKKQGTSAKK